MESILYRTSLLVPLFRKGRGLTRDQVSVHYDPRTFNQDYFEGQKSEIDAEWSARIRTNPRLYDAPKFRLAGLVPGLPLALNIGVTSYKDLMGTHHGPNPKELVERGGDDRYRYLSNAIGVGAITVTSDNEVVLCRRAGWTGEGAGRLDRPGGHPEPEAVEGRKGTASCFSALDPEAVLKEIFESPAKELRDEINIPLEDQEEPQLLGEIRDVNRGGRCGLDFHIPLRVDKNTVIKRYERGEQSEADESTGLHFLPLDSVRLWNFEEELINQMTCHCVGGLRLLHLAMAEAKG